MSKRVTRRIEQPPFIGTESYRMKKHQYRDQLIRVVATETPRTQYWGARADIRYQDRKDFGVSL